MWMLYLCSIDSVGESWNFPHKLILFQFWVQTTDISEARDSIFTPWLYRPVCWSPFTPRGPFFPPNYFRWSCCCSSRPDGGAVTHNVWITSLPLALSSHWSSVKSTPSLGVVISTRMKKYPAGFTKSWTTLTIRVLQHVGNTSAASSVR